MPKGINNCTTNGIEFPNNLVYDLIGYVSGADVYLQRSIIQKLFAKAPANLSDALDTVDMVYGYGWTRGYLEAWRGIPRKVADKHIHEAFNFFRVQPEIKQLQCKPVVGTLDSWYAEDKLTRLQYSALMSIKLSPAIAEQYKSTSGYRPIPAYIAHIKEKGKKWRTNSKVSVAIGLDVEKLFGLQ